MMGVDMETTTSSFNGATTLESWKGSPLPSFTVRVLRLQWGHDS